LSRIGEILNFIYSLIFFTLLSTKFQINQEYIYKFLKNAIELGFSFKLNKYVDNYEYHKKAIIKNRLYVYIIISIIILLLILKRTFFGSFKSNLLYWIFFIISILSFIQFIKYNINFFFQFLHLYYYYRYFLKQNYL